VVFVDEAAEDLRSGVKATTVGGTSATSTADKYTYVYTYVAPYPFTGFLFPIHNPPTINPAIAGLPAPMGFSLGGNKGRGVITAGSPTSQQVNCTTGAPTGPATPTTTVANVGLVYIPLNGTYLYAWQTLPAWHDTCRVFTMKLNDFTSHTAEFKVL
jgi:hypothetical protein